jgi:hypothetical protein
MSGPRPRRDRGPRRVDLLDALDEAERRLSDMVGRWTNGTPAVLRVELRDIGTPLLRLLLRAGRR